MRQQKSIAHDTLANGSQLPLHLRQIKGRCAADNNLYGVAATERGGRCTGACIQKIIIVGGAGKAVGIAVEQPQRFILVRPQVHMQQPLVQYTCARNELDGLAGADCADQADRGAMLAVSQPGVVPGVGISLNRQRRQPVALRPPGSAASALSGTKVAAMP